MLVAVASGCPGDPPSLDGVSTSGGSSTGGDVTGGTDTSVDESTAAEVPCAGCDGVCIDDACCPRTRACEGVCCDDGQACAFGSCVTPAGGCVHASECASGQLCDTTLGGASATAADCTEAMTFAGQCVVALPDCAAGETPVPGEAPTCLPACELPAADDFGPVLQVQWIPPRPQGIVVSPLVVPLDDDNCDGLVNEEDRPDIVVMTYEGGEEENGRLYALQVDDGQVQTKWVVEPVDVELFGDRPLAAGDLDGVPGAEIVACVRNSAYGGSGQVRAFAGDGTVLWTSTEQGICQAPSIADVDGNGTAEVVTVGGVLDGQTGAMIVAAPLNLGRTAVAVDIDGDGQREIVGGRGAYELDGTVIADTGTGANYVAVADLDGDQTPEVVGIRNNGNLDIWRLDPTSPSGVDVFRGGVQLFNQCLGANGGMPAIADANFDGILDIAVSAGDQLSVIDGARALDDRIGDGQIFLWQAPIDDCGFSETATTFFDHDADGRADVFHADRDNMRAYGGANGDVFWQICADSTRRQDGPVFADVDGDGRTELLVVGDGNEICFDGSVSTGLRVFGDGQDRWARTRRVWNQHGYQTSFIGDDGRVPAGAVRHWTDPATNDYRRAAHPGGALSAPDLVGRVLPACVGGERAAIVRVRNLGRAPVPAGVAVEVYDGAPQPGSEPFATVTTGQQLYPGQAEDTVVPVASASSPQIHIVIDPAGGPHPWAECRTDNNTASATVGCP